MITFRITILHESGKVCTLEDPITTDRNNITRVFDFEDPIIILTITTSEFEKSVDDVFFSLFFFHQLTLKL